MWEKDDWIPVSTINPWKSGKYLAFVKTNDSSYGSQEMAYYDADYKCGWCTHNPFGFVVAWMECGPNP